MDAVVNAYKEFANIHKEYHPGYRQTRQINQGTNERVLGCTGPCRGIGEALMPTGEFTNSRYSCLHGTGVHKYD
jgi:hypothetical protein